MSPSSRRCIRRFEMTTGPVLLEIDGPIATIRLNRPDAGNAIDVALAQAFLEAVIRIESDPAVRSLLLTGSGSMFCAGGDVNAFAAAGDGVRRAARRDAALGHHLGRGRQHLHPPDLRRQRHRHCQVEGRQAGHHRPRHRVRKGRAKAAAGQSKPSMDRATAANRSSSRPSSPSPSGPN